MIYFADDNTLSAFAKSIPELINILERESEKAIKWFDDNEMIANGRYNDLHEFNIGGFTISSKTYVELLGIEIDFKLNFNKYLAKICKKAGGQLNTICRYNKFIDLEEKRTLI